MDKISISISDNSNVNIGDKVELWGEHVSIEEISEMANTIPYTLLCGLTNRVPRKYIFKNQE